MPRPSRAADPLTCAPGGSEPPGRGGPAGRFDGRRAGSAARGRQSLGPWRPAAGQPPTVADGTGAWLGAGLAGAPEPEGASSEGAGVMAGMGGLDG